jgi:hypothetical protein
MQKTVIINLKGRRISYENKKNNNNTIYKIISKNKKYFNIFIYFLINLFSIYLSNEKILLSKLNIFSEINLTIIGNGTQKILCNKQQDVDSKS